MPNMNKRSRFHVAKIKNKIGTEFIIHQIKASKVTLFFDNLPP
tara:strand:- start:432 stop:560 length:129 start_codon:yes stop_codon:yes gene_type:complete